MKTSQFFYKGVALTLAAILFAQPVANVMATKVSAEEVSAMPGNSQKLQTEMEYNLGNALDRITGKIDRGMLAESPQDILLGKTVIADATVSYGESMVVYDENAGFFSRMLRSSPAVGYQGSYNNITWVFNLGTGELKITGSGTVYPAWVDPNGSSLAESIKTVTVGSGITAIGDTAFAYCSNLTKVTLPSTVLSIDYGAFAYCSSLSTITIPSSVTALADYAFYNCINLKTITLSSKLQTIGEYTFHSCKSLSAITLPSALLSIGSASFAFCETLKTISFPNNCTVIPDLAFYGCKALTQVTFPQKTDSIGDRTFYGCTALKEIMLPNTVKNLAFGCFADCTGLEKATISGNIGEAAFFCCTNLRSVTAANVGTVGKQAFNACTMLATITLPDNCTQLGEQAFIGCASLETVTFPSGLQSIGDFCFYACSSLKEAVLPEGLKKLGNTVFGGDEQNGWCDSLAYVKIPATLDTVGEYCFEVCRNLTTVDMPKTVSGNWKKLSSYMFTNCTALKTIALPSNLTVIGTGCFVNCKSMTSIQLPKTLTEIGSGAFGYCTALAQPEIPTQCTTIGEQAFYSCSALKSVTLPEGLVKLADAVFYECTALSDVSLPSSLQTVGSHAFKGCTSLKQVSLGSNLSSLGIYSFAECKQLKQLSVPAKVTLIPEGVFSYCSALTKVVLPSSVTEIGKGAFVDCTSLSAVAIPSNVKVIGEGAFLHCAALTNVVLPKGVTKIQDGTFHSCYELETIEIQGPVSAIGEYAFTNCHKLAAISVPDTVTSIGSYAFTNCAALSAITLPDGIETIPELVFANCTGLKSFTIGKRIESIGMYAFAGCTALEQFVIDSGNAAYSSLGGVLYTADRKQLLAYPSAKSATSFTVPTTVTAIAPGAFYMCKNLKELRLPEKIDCIPDRAFYSCAALRHIYLPDAVTSLGAFALAGCKALQELSIPDTVRSVGAGAFQGAGIETLALPDGITAIPEYLFADCTNLKQVQLPDTVTQFGAYSFGWCGALDEIPLPPNLDVIGEGAFFQCDVLRSLVLPEGVEYIDAHTFAQCDALEDIAFDGNIFAVGNYAFSGDSILMDVMFAGDAPETIGTDAFKGTTSSMKLHYSPAAENWTSPTWTGPDGVVYNTEQMKSGKCGDHATWQLTSYNGTLMISGSGEMYSWTSAEKAPWYSVRDEIVSVRICEGITSVGARAFMGCKNLTSVKLPNSIAECGYGAFADCVQLENVDTGSGLLSVSQCMFYGCSNLKYISLNEKLEKIGAYAFFGCTSLSSVQIPEGVTTIEEGTFADCVSLQEAVFRGNVQKLDSGAFLNCVALQAMEFSGTIPQDIHQYALAGINENTILFSQDNTDQWTDAEGNVFSHISTDNLRGSCGNSLNWEINIEDHTLRIRGSGAMYDYESGGSPWLINSLLINQIVIEQGAVSIGSFAFENMHYVERISIPDTVTRVGDYAFSNCTGLAEIQLPSRLEKLEEGAFLGCTQLESIVVPESITKIAPYTFMMCELLSYVMLPDGVTEIGYGAFYTCPSLTSITLPASLETIDDWAFAHCVALEAVTLPADVAQVGAYAFYQCMALTGIALNRSLQCLGEYCFSQAPVVEITLPAGVETIPASAFELCEELAQVILTDAVKTVGESAFYGCTALTSIDLRKVVTIEDMAFAASGLQSANIPSTVEQIGVYAFADCAQLSYISSQSEVYPSEDGVLYSDTALIQYPAGKEDEDFLLPSRASGIAEGAFYGSTNLRRIHIGDQTGTIGKAAFALARSLEEVYLGKNVTVLEEAVFGECPELVRVEFSGAAPELATDVFYNTASGLKLYYTEGQEGWEEGTWTGSDGIAYQTVMQPAKIEQATAMCLSEQSATDSAVILRVDLTAGSDIDHVDALLVMAMFREGQMLTSCTKTVSLVPGSIYNFHFSASAVDHDGCEYKAFLLSEENHVPLTTHTRMTSDTALGSYVGAPVIEEYVSDCPELPEVDKPDHDIDIDRPNLPDNPANGSTPELPGVTKSDDELGNPVTYLSSTAVAYAADSLVDSEHGMITEMTFESKDMVQTYMDMVNGKFNPEISNKPTTPVSIKTSVGGWSKVFNSFDGSLLSIPIIKYDQLGNVYNEGETELFNFSYAVPFEFGFAELDKGLFLKPSSALSANICFDVVKTDWQRERVWEIGKYKVKAELKPRVLEAEAGASGNLNFDDVEFSAKAGVDVAEIGGKITVSTNNDTELFAVSAGLGLGRSVMASATYKKGSKYALKAGFKNGIGGNLGIELFPEAIANLGNYFAQQKANIKALKHALIVKVMDENGELGQILCCLFIQDHVTGEVVKLIKAEMQKQDAVTDEVYQKALPKSEGGSKQPEPEKELSQNGGNSAGKKPESTTPKEEKEETKQNITLTKEQEAQIIAALLRAQMFGVPATNDIQTMLGNWGFDSLAPAMIYPSILSPTIIQHIEMSTSARPLF